MLSVVSRPFRSDREHAVGELLDTSGWRLERNLIDQRFIRPATPDETHEFQASQKKSAKPKAAETRGSSAPPVADTAETPKGARSAKIPKPKPARASAKKK
jgi:hypothetical protein